MIGEKYVFCCSDHISFKPTIHLKLKSFENKVFKWFLLQLLCEKIRWLFCYHRMTWAKAVITSSSFVIMSTLKWEVKWTPTGLRFQTDVKTSSVHMKLHFGCISKRTNILMDMCRHLISGNAYMIFYHLKWNFIFVKMTDMKSIPTLSFKRTCALIATPPSLCLFTSFWVNHVHMKISYRLEIFFQSKDWYEIHTVLSFILP